jgi:hypothetical protein
VKNRVEEKKRNEEDENEKREGGVRKGQESSL